MRNRGMGEKLTKSVIAHTHIHAGCTRTDAFAFHSAIVELVAVMKNVVEVDL